LSVDIFLNNHFALYRDFLKLFSLITLLFFFFFFFFLESCISENEDEWVEKSGKSSSSTQLSDATADMKISLEAAKAERDEWMSLPGLIPCVSRNELKKVNKEKLEAEEKQKFMLDRVSTVVGCYNSIYVQPLHKL
jgi:hypothetical protein